MNREYRCACALAFAFVLCGASAFAQLRLETYVTGLTQPVALVSDPSDPTIEFVVQQNGLIRTIVKGVLFETPFLDLSQTISTGGERGLLGLAFPPNYAGTGRLFVDFTDRSGNTVVSRFRRSSNPYLADPATRFDLMWSTGLRHIQQPYSNHNGGCLAFGPDGYLYVGMGDGGSADDPENRAQNPQELLGKILRIDVDVPASDPAGFRVPPDNPFAHAASATTRQEIWSFGLRNPWKFSFDDPGLGGTGAMIIGDVGQDSWEEVDYEPAGAGGRNYGWRNREGAHDNVTSLPPAFLPLRDPVYEYDHSVGHSITGGYLYRGGRSVTLQGRYVFGDFVAGRVWSLVIAVDPVSGVARATDVKEHTAELGGPAVLGNVSSFGLGAAGQLYVLNYAAGTVLRVRETPPTPQNLRIIKPL